MDDYQLPKKTLTLKAIPKTSSAIGLYFICPSCRYEMIQSDVKLTRIHGGCPNCHTDLTFPEMEELDLIYKQLANIYTP